MQNTLHLDDIRMKHIRCPKCGGNIFWARDLLPSGRGEQFDLACLQCGLVLYAERRGSRLVRWAGRGYIVEVAEAVKLSHRVRQAVAEAVARSRRWEGVDQADIQEAIANTWTSAAS